MPLHPTAAPVAELLALISAQRSQIVALSARVAELERRLGLNSSNSGKPPSSDGLQKPPRTASLRERSGRAPGGQKGHRGTTLAQVATADVTVEHFPAHCADCGAALSQGMSSGHAARQVFDLPAPSPLVVTEHRAHRCRCAACGGVTRAAFPAAVAAPVQYGPRIGAVVTYLQAWQLLPEKRLATLLADLFALRLSTASIARIIGDRAAGLAGFAAAVRGHVAAAKVKHLDETGLRIGARTHWLHVASTRLLTHYRISPRRGSLAEALGGIVVHDHWKPYYTLRGVSHALCNAHHLRELQALIEIEREDWARPMRTLLRRACHAANLARAQAMALPQRLAGLIERAYARIIAAGLAWHDAQPALPRRGPRGRHPHRIGHNLLLRLSTRSDDVLRFLADPDIPFSNNQAEQDARMMKLRQKISGGFRSQHGANRFADIRTLLSTARKQGWDVLHALIQKPDLLIPQIKLA